MDTQATHTLATDEQTSSVRPADARYNRTEFTTEQLTAVREQEIEDATVALLEKRKAEDEANQKALDESGYVNPTVQPEESPMARAFEKVYGSGSSRDGWDDAEDGGDQYDAMSYPELQSAASTRDGVKGNLPMDELRAALRADDAARAGN